MLASVRKSSSLAVAGINRMRLLSGNNALSAQKATEKI